jgi:hypothetical protein
MLTWESNQRRPGEKILAYAHGRSVLSHPFDPLSGVVRMGHAA